MHWKMRGMLLKYLENSIDMNPYEPILEEIATGLLEVAEIKPNFSDNALLNATVIFQSVFMDKVFDCMQKDGIPHEDQLKMVQSAGEEIRRIIHTYTGLDTHELVNKM
jgi:hypothetical protein